jgi:hypothetical protein
MTATAGVRSSKNTWPRVRLLLRSAISSIMPIGWTWAAATALIPYLWAERGPGTSGLSLMGLTRTTWMSLHVWSSIAMVVLTIAHTLLNRKGVSKSYKVMAGTRTSSVAGTTARPWPWLVGAATMALIVILGGFWFASIDDHLGGNNTVGDTSTAQVVDDLSSGGTGGTGWGRNGGGNR